MVDQMISTTERFLRLFQRLGIQRAHLAGAPGEIIDFAAAHPEMAASVTLVCPFQPIPVDHLEAVRDRLCFIHGDMGPSASRVPSVLGRFPSATDIVLREFVDAVWSDPVGDRAGDIGSALLAFLDQFPDARGVREDNVDEQAGEVDGITYRVGGAGPPLVLLPFNLAASQWEPILPMLRQSYRTVVLGGAYVGAVARLAQRARAGFGDTLRAFIAQLAPLPGSKVLDVGCGSGEITRMLAEQTSEACPITGVDVNTYLIREAASLTASLMPGHQITFKEGNAEALPFPDETFDVTVSCTVMEEGDADRMLAEMIRVTRPGGQVAVVVRATDMPAWINLTLPPAIMAKLEYAGSAGVAEVGCADASLYRRFLACGLTDLRMGPQYATNHAGPAYAEVRQIFEPAMRGVLGVDERSVWDDAVARADADGTLMWANTLHCAVGRKPVPPC